MMPTVAVNRAPQHLGMQQDAARSRALFIQINALRIDFRHVPARFQGQSEETR